jgi:hypothetical protein
VNLVTEEARKVQEQQAEIVADLRQKKNVLREKQVYNYQSIIYLDIL